MNLETELLKQNRKLIMPSELLALREYENKTDVADSDTLSRIGINTSALKGKETKTRVRRLKKDTRGFSKERVFHISQIESVCRKYALRFLPSENFTGSVDKQLAVKIDAFELTHNVRCRKDNSFIMAPASSFKLEPRPKDPLFFYQINEEYYYLIHKWGDDLSAFRRIQGVVSSAVGQILACASVAMGLVGLFMWYVGLPEGTSTLEAVGVFFGLSFITLILGSLIVFGGFELELPDADNWNKAHW